MRIDRLVLEDFRNYERAEIELDPGLNLVVGSNAQGKTNLLEAAHCLSGLGSPRGPDVTLVREGAERALLHGTVTRGERTVQIDLEMRPGKGTRALLNRTPVAGARALSEVFTAVFFGPDELALIKGGPDRRRRFSDDLVVKLRPAREGLRREWERVLKQRNALLKSAPRNMQDRSLATLDVWDGALVKAGAALTASRLGAIAALVPFARKRYQQIAGAGTLQLTYISSWLDDDAAHAALEPQALTDADLRAQLERAIATHRPRELERGISLVGPHRDDVGVHLGTDGASGTGMLEARGYASQGDQRTAALALRLGEYDLLTETLGDQPVLLLDDVFSELDPDRRAWLTDSVRSSGQTIVTSAEPGALDAAGPARVIEVTAGKLRSDA